MQKHIIVCSLLLLFAGCPLALRGDCDCLHPPWPPKCKSECSKQIINKASERDLVRILRVGRSTASKIVQERKKEEFDSVDDLRRILPDEKVRAIKKRIEKLSKEEPL
jgi:DNA uptake protein ComE-like DNA-binding protein